MWEPLRSRCSVFPFHVPLSLARALSRDGEEEEFYNKKRKKVKKQRSATDTLDRATNQRSTNRDNYRGSCHFNHNFTCEKRAR